MPSDVLGRCHKFRCDMVAALAVGDVFCLALPRQIAQFKAGFMFIAKVLSAEEDEEVQYGENKHVEYQVIYRRKQRSKR